MKYPYGKDKDTLLAKERLRQKMAGAGSVIEQLKADVGNLPPEKASEVVKKFADAKAAMDEKEAEVAAAYDKLDDQRKSDFLAGLDAAATAKETFKVDITEEVSLDIPAAAEEINAVAVQVEVAEMPTINGSFSPEALAAIGAIAEKETKSPSKRSRRKKS